MKTTNYFVTPLLIAGMLTSTMVTAQNDTADLTSSSNAVSTSLVAESTNKINPVIMDQMSAGNSLLLIYDEQNNMIKLNHVLPAFTYSAVLLIQDFTGRAIKTFNVNIHNTINQEFYINDLLSGSYNYSLVLDNQKKITGKFLVKD